MFRDFIYQFFSFVKSQPLLMNRTHLSSQVSLIRQRKRGRDTDTEKKEQI